MYESKTKPTDASVEQFISQISDEQKKADSLRLVELMQNATGEPAQMWGTSIIGFGAYHYKYASGHEGDACQAGFSPRKQNLTLYFTGRLEDQADLLARLGKHKTGVGCVYIKKLEDIDTAVLEEMLRRNAVLLQGI